MEDIDPDTYQQAVREHARYLGIDPDADSDLLWLAAEALTAELPPDWETGSTGDGVMYYYNTTSGESMWEHPLDSTYRERYHELKAAAAVGHSPSSVAANITTPSPSGFETESSPSRGSLPKPLMRHNSDGGLRHEGTLADSGQPEGASTALRTTTYASPANTLSSIGKLLRMGKMEEGEMEMPLQPPSPARDASISPARMSPSRTPPSSPHLQAPLGSQALNSAVGKVRALSKTSPLSSTSSPPPVHAPPAAIQRPLGAPPSGAPGIAPVAATVVGGGAPDPSTKRVSPRSSDSGDAAKGALAPLTSPHPQMSPGAPSQHTTASKADSEWDIDDDDAEFAQVMTGRVAAAGRGDKSGSARALTLSQSHSPQPGGSHALSSPLASPVGTSAGGSKVVASTPSPPRSAERSLAGWSPQPSAAAGTPGTPGGEEHSPLRRTMTAGKLRTHSKGEELALQRRVDAAVAATKAELEMEALKLKSQYANIGAKNAADLARARTERDELLAKLAKAQGEASTAVSRMALLEQTANEATAKSRTAMTDLAEERAEKARLAALLQGSEMDGGRARSSLEAQLLEVQGHLLTEQRGRSDDVARLEAAQKVLEGELEALRHERGKVVSELIAAEERALRLKSHADTTESRSSDVLTSLESIKGALTHSEEECSQLRSEATAQASRLSELQHQAALAREELASWKTKASDAIAQYADAMANVGEVRAASDSASVLLEHQLRDVRAEAEALSASYESQRSQVIADHDRALSALKVDHAAALAAMQASGAAAVSTARLEAAAEASRRQAEHGSAIQALQDRIDELERAAHTHENEAMAALADARRRDAEVAAGTLSDLQSNYEEKIKAATEAASKVCRTQMHAFTIDACG